MDRELERFLFEVSNRHGIPVDDIVIEALELWLAQHPENLIQKAKEFRAALRDPKVQEIIDYFCGSRSEKHT